MREEEVDEFEFDCINHYLENEGNNISFLSKHIKNVILRWDANIDKELFFHKEEGKPAEEQEEDQDYAEVNDIKDLQIQQSEWGGDLNKSRAMSMRSGRVDQSYMVDAFTVDAQALGGNTGGIVSQLIIQNPGTREAYVIDIPLSWVVKSLAKLKARYDDIFTANIYPNFVIKKCLQNKYKHTNYVVVGFDLGNVGHPEIEAPTVMMPCINPDVVQVRVCATSNVL